MIKFGKGALLAVAVSLALQGVAYAAYGLNTADEVKAQRKTAKEGAKYTKKAATCVSKCVGAQSKVPTNHLACLVPYTDPAVSACLNDPLKGATPKFSSGLAKACAVDAPECWGATCAVYSSTHPDDVLGQINPFGLGVFGGVAFTATADEVKCMSGMSKALVKYVGAMGKCADKCVNSAVKGAVTDTDCLNNSEAAQTACIAAAGVKVTADIAKLSGCPASFYLPSIAAYGEVLRGLAETAIDSTNDAVFCIDSPSGAFLD